MTLLAESPVFHDIVVARLLFSSGVLCGKNYDDCFAVLAYDRIAAMIPPNFRLPVFQPVDHGGHIAGDVTVDGTGRDCAVRRDHFCGLGIVVSDRPTIQGILHVHVRRMAAGLYGLQNLRMLFLSCVQRPHGDPDTRGDLLVGQAISCPAFDLGQVFFCQPFVRFCFHEEPP